MTLEEARKKARCNVIWSTRPGEAEAGVITGVRGEYVLVRFGDQKYPKACYPEDLTLMRGSSVAEHILMNQRDAGFPTYGDVPGFRPGDEPGHGYWEAGDL